MRVLNLQANKETDRIVAGASCTGCGQEIGYNRPYQIRMVDKKQGGIERRHVNCAPKKTLIDDPDEE